MSDYKSLRFYKKHLRCRYKKLFPCSFCEEMILAENYENHITNRKHDLDVKRKCPWCQTFSWVYGKKHQNMDHLKNCAERFFNPKNTEPVYDLTPEFNTKDFFGEENLCLSNRFYCPVKDDADFDADYNVPDKYMLDFDSRTERILKEWNGLTFQSDLLNQAADFMKYYVLTSTYGFEKRDWFHIMIRTVAINRFYETFDEHDGGRSQILPYYCHCTGGKKSTNYVYDQHIHLLLVTNSDKHFENEVWVRFYYSARPRRNYNCKYKKPIVSPLHFLNTIGYLSGRKSRCQFGRSRSAESRLNHFNLNCSLPKDFKYALAILWDTGLQDLVGDVHQNDKPEFNLDYKTDDSGVVFVDGQWKIKYINIPGLLEKILKIPINLHYRRVDYKTNIYLHLGKKYTLYLEYDDQCRLSIETLRDGLTRDYFTYRPKIQGTFNTVKRKIDNLLEMKNIEMERMNNTLQMELREMNQNHQKTIENRQKTIENLQNMIENLKNTIQANNTQLEDLNKNRHKDLREWIVNLQKTIENLQKTIENLQKTIENQQTEIRELKYTIHAKEMEMKKNPVYYVSITP